MDMRYKVNGSAEMTDNTLRQALAMHDDIARHLAECEAKQQALLGQLSQGKVDLGKAPKVGSKSRRRPGLPTQPGNGCRVKTIVFSFVS